MGATTMLNCQRFDRIQIGNQRDDLGAMRSIRSTVFNGRIYIEKINEPFLYRLKGAPAEFKAGLGAPIANGWLALLLKFTEAGAALFT